MRPTRKHQPGRLQKLPYMVLHLAGFTVPQCVATLRGGLLHPLFTLTIKNGGIFSVALSVTSRYLGVTQRHALRCSDFPLTSTNRNQRPHGSLINRIFINGLVCKSVSLFIFISRNIGNLKRGQLIYQGFCFFEKQSDIRVFYFPASVYLVCKKLGIGEKFYGLIYVRGD